MYKIFLYVIVLIVLMPNCSTGQVEDTPNPSGLTINLNHLSGFIYEHSEKMAHLTDQYPTAFELDINKQTYGNRPWQQLYNFPQFGVSVHYFNMDSEKPLGDMISITPYFNPILYRSSGLIVSYRIGLGGSYISRGFHPESNPDNVLISSRLNFSLYGNINIRKYLFKNLHVNAGVSLIHYSNGSFKTPNLGINIPAIHVGLGYGQQPQKSFHEDDMSAHERTYYFNLISNFGIKEYRTPGGDKFLNMSGCMFVSRTLNHKSSITAGLDLFYNGTYILLANNPDPDDLVYQLTSGITVGHELTVARLSMLTQMGIYIYDPLTPTPPVYQRYYLRYFFTSNLNIGVGLKTHYGYADFVEWGLGIRL
ncbi:acyloxyacyl hydrolase [Cytophagaceae bacterium ABcell3]|nr:acyloxyacyl hydrolase [Cytophagaceae bacterium ABcell3]